MKRIHSRMLVAFVVMAGLQSWQSTAVAEEPTSPLATSRAETPLYPELPLRRGADASLSNAASSGLGVAGALLLAAVAVLAAWKVKAVSRQVASSAQPGGSGWLRRLMPGLPGGPVEVVQSVRLTGHASIHVVRWQGKELLVGCSDQEVTVLGQDAGRTAWAYSPRESSATGQDVVNGA